MAQYLRDEQLSNLTIDAAALRELSDVFEQRGLVMPEYHEVQADEAPTVLYFILTIRFDEKGYQVFSIERLLEYFGRANKVERVIFNLNSAESLTTNKNTGSYATLNLDNNEAVNSVLTVASDDEEWVNCTFAAVNSVIARHKNRHALFRNPAVDLLVQFLGIIIGFFISLWGASIIAPKLSIENAYVISFIVVLILFSNLWDLVKTWLNNILRLSFPRIEFFRPKKDGSHWLLQTLVGSIVVALTFYILTWIFTYIGSVLGAFIK